MKDRNRGDFLGLLLVFAGVLLIVCWFTEWFERETLQWLWILLLYFWIGYVSGEMGALSRRLSWGFETGFLASDSLNTRQLTIRALKGGGGLAIENDSGARIAVESQGDRLLLSIQDDRGKALTTIDVRELAALTRALLRKASSDSIAAGNPSGAS